MKPSKKGISNSSDNGQKYFRFKIGDQTIRIPIDAELKANFHNQFKKNTEDQMKRYTTLTNLVRAAYRAGLKTKSE